MRNQNGKATVVVLTAVLAGCASSSHETQPATLGVVRGSAELVSSLEQPGVIELETINSADWQVDRSGLLNLSNPTAKAAGLVDGPEAIQVFFHVLRHPTKGVFIVDTGVEKALRDAPERSALGALVRSAMHLDTMKVHLPLGEWVAKEPRLDGVFLTHLHLDHIAGAADLPKNTPVFSGPGETRSTQVMNMFVRGSTDRALSGLPAISEWQFAVDPSGAFDGVLDVFGDGSVWALWVPGHTAGSTAYLVRTTHGPVLLTGDACHTRWGWEHHVEPGSFTADAPRGVESLNKLEAFASAHPNVEVRLGHQ